MKLDVPTFEEELDKYIEYDDIRGIMVLIDKNLYTLGIDTKDDEELRAWIDRVRPTLIEEVKTANIELQKRLPKYIGDITTEGDLLEKLEAIEPKYNDTCVKIWYDEIVSFETIKTSNVGYYIDKYILNIEHNPYSFGKVEYVYLADTDEEVRADEFYPFLKKASAIALAYANEELLKRLEQLEDMTDETTQNPKE